MLEMTQYNTTLTNFNVLLRIKRVQAKLGLLMTPTPTLPFVLCHAKKMPLGNFIFFVVLYHLHRSQNVEFHFITVHHHLNDNGLYNYSRADIFC